MKIGIFGGSFDPVHTGHLLVAQAAFEELQLSRLFFVLAAQSPFKPEACPASAKLRAMMLRRALAGKTFYEVDEQEIRRGGVSYSIETARNFRQRFPNAQLFYLIGADNVPSLPKWREAEALAKLVEFVVVPRPGEKDLPSLPPPFQLRLLRGFPLAVSSSQIRERVKAGLSVETLVPPEVFEVIRNNRLYL